MARRVYTSRFRCVEDGCTEVGLFESESRREEQATYQRHTGKWRCSRHERPREVLSKTNTRRTIEITCESSSRADGLFWSTGSGYASGPGWKAWASDFPEGTRICVTVEVILPAEATEDAGA